jgi:hypothetical protein
VLQIILLHILSPVVHALVAITQVIESSLAFFTALAEASVIVRDHAPSTNLFMCLWFNEVVRFTSRDQLSFPYVLRRVKPPGVHLFPVCARKELVNTMGHRRKVKPLVKDARQASEE